MADCSTIDRLVTPYIDGELGPGDRDAVAEHITRCPPCRARIASEQVSRDVVRNARAALRQQFAPHALRVACGRLNEPSRGERWARPSTSTRPNAASSGWRSRLAPFALAATLVLMVGVAFLYRLTDSSAQVLAAELTADHLKCLAVNSLLGTHESVSNVEASLASGFAWPVQLSEAGRAGLDVVGSRPCLYAKGRVAHVMFTHNGRAVSLFMLPGAVRPEQYVGVFGHEAAIWCTGTRTFVLIARESRAEVKQLAAAMHASLR